MKMGLYFNDLKSYNNFLINVEDLMLISDLTKIGHK